MTRQRYLVGILVVALIALTGEAVAKDRIQQTIDMPAQFAATIQTTDCTVTPGPRVTLQGGLTMAPLDIEVVFSHLMGAGNPHGGVTVKKAVVPTDAPPTPSPQQAIVGAFAGNPFLWLQLTDSRGRPLTSEVFLGRCDEGQFQKTIDVALPVETSADVSAEACEVSTGPIIDLNGQIQVSPIHGKVIFRSTDAAGGGQKPAEVAIDLVFISPGPTFLLPQEQAQAGTGGNPLISTQYRLANGAAIGVEEKLGRCSSLVK